MRRVTYCAEIGSAHKGEKSLAYEYIRQAKLANAHIAKFQLGHPKTGGRYQHMRYAPMEWVEELAEWCEDIGIGFMASIFSEEALELAKAIDMKQYKIAHQLAQDPSQDSRKLVAAIIATGRPVYLSGSDKYQDGNVYPVYVHNTYPCYQPHMPKDFSSWYGYSSHAHGAGDKLLAIARGAKFVEAHIALDKTEESIKDNHFALDPSEFKDMVTYGNEISRAAGPRQP